MKGKVKWFDNQKGYGFIASEDGKDVFVNCSAIVGIKELYENEEVIFNYILDSLNMPRTTIVHHIEEKKVNVVTVRWLDGHKEDFRAIEVRFGSDLLWIRLEDGNNRHIPLKMVRWFDTSIESHQNTGM